MACLGDTKAAIRLYGLHEAKGGDAACTHDTSISTNGSLASPAIGPDGSKGRSDFRGWSCHRDQRLFACHSWLLRESRTSDVSGNQPSGCPVSRAGMHRHFTADPPLRSGCYTQCPPACSARIRTNLCSSASQGGARTGRPLSEVLGQGLERSQPGA